MSNNPPTPQKPTKPSNEKQKSSKLPKPPTSKKPSLWAWVAIATFAIILISTSSSLLNSKDIKSIIVLIINIQYIKLIIIEKNYIYIFV